MSENSRLVKDTKRMILQCLTSCFILIAGAIWLIWDTDIGWILIVVGFVTFYCAIHQYSERHGFCNDELQ